MATSGSIDFTLTGGEIVEEAYKLLGIKATGVSLTAEQQNDGLTTFNLMIKSWMSKGIRLWAYQEGVLFLDVGKTDYLLGGSTGDEATTLDDFIGTTLTTTEAAAQTVLSVASTTGMAVSDNVGIKLDDDTRHWTTIVSVDSSTQITITTGLPSIASENNSVFTFTTYIQRPLDVTDSRRKTFDEDNEIEIDEWSRQEYFNQVNKESQGTPVNWYYSPLLNQGRFYVWQTASDPDQLIRFTFYRTLEDIDNNSNNVDFPQEWEEALTYNLATRVGVNNGVVSEDPVRFNFIVQRAQELLDDVEGWDIEHVSLNLQPNLRP